MVADLLIVTVFSSVIGLIFSTIPSLLSSRLPDLLAKLRTMFEPKRKFVDNDCGATSTLMVMSDYGRGGGCHQVFDDTKQVRRLDRPQ